MSSGFVPKRRAVLVAAAMVSAAAVGNLARPTKHLADIVGKPDLEKIFPLSFERWRQDLAIPVVLPAPDVQAKLDSIYNQVLTRTYVNDRGQRIMLSVAYGGDQSDGTRAHRPEVCYPAQGFIVTYEGKRHVALSGNAQLPVRVLMTRLSNRHEPITYWMVVGGEAVTSGGEQKLVELRLGLKGYIPDGMLIRVSSIDPDMDAGLAVQQAFIRALSASVDAAAGQRIFGSGAA